NCDRGDATAGSFFDCDVHREASSNLAKCSGSVDDRSGRAFPNDLRAAHGIDFAVLDSLAILGHAQQSVRVVTEQICLYQVLRNLGCRRRGNAKPLKDGSDDTFELLNVDCGHLLNHCFVMSYKRSSDAVRPPEASIANFHFKQKEAKHKT